MIERPMRHECVRRSTPLLILAAAWPVAILAQSNIDPDHKFGWGENVGWTNWRDADGANQGVAVGEKFLAGYLWGENVGWINVGDGTPANGQKYANLDDTDYGVNVESNGDLSGLGWGENIGWVNFDTRSKGDDRARYDLCEHRFFGFAWGENVGWINLNDATHYVGTALPDCDKINALKVKCKRGTLKIQIKSDLPKGTALSIIDRFDNYQACLILNARGAAKRTRRNQTGEHEVCIVECPRCRRDTCPP